MSIPNTALVRWFGNGSKKWDGMQLPVPLHKIREVNGENVEKLSAPLDPGDTVLVQWWFGGRPYWQGEIISAAGSNAQDTINAADDQPLAQLQLQSNRSASPLDHVTVTTPSAGPSKCTGQAAQEACQGKSPGGRKRPALQTNKTSGESKKRQPPADFLSLSALAAESDSSDNEVPPNHVDFMDKRHSLLSQLLYTQQQILLILGADSTLENEPTSFMEQQQQERQLQGQQLWDSTQGLQFQPMLDVLCDPKWKGMTAKKGAPRLTCRLAEYCYFGRKLLQTSTVTGNSSRSSLPGLDKKKLAEIKVAVENVYCPVLDDKQFEPIWRSCRVSLMHKCKALRRLKAAQAASQEVETASQEAQEQEQ